MRDGSAHIKVDLEKDPHYGQRLMWCNKGDVHEDWVRGYVGLALENNLFDVLTRVASTSSSTERLPALSRLVDFGGGGWEIGGLWTSSVESGTENLWRLLRSFKMA
jgi:hypothetical protein